MTIAAYDTIAEWYDHWLGAGAVSAGLDPYFSAAEALVGDLDGRLVCDLGCGQGRVARRLTERGARVVGIDVSARLLQIARRHEADTPGRVSYVRADASRLDCIAPDVFDGIVCYMALMDIEDLGSTVQHVRRVLRPGGWFLFTILHPCYNPGRSGELTTPEGLVRTVAGYFEEGHWTSEARTGPPGKVGSHHRMLSTYLNLLCGAGLVLDQTSEPSAPGGPAARRPIWTEVPALLTMRWRKPGATLATSNLTGASRQP